MNFKRFKREINRDGFFLFIFVILLFIYTLGLRANIEVVTNNNCKMPVYFSDYSYEDADHFTYTNFSEVKHPALSDIFKFKTYLYSIGDILQWFALIGLISISSVHVYKTIKNRLLRK